MSEQKDDRGHADFQPALRSLEGELMALIASNAMRLRYMAILGAGIAAAILMLHVPAAYAVGWWALVAAAILVRTKWLVDAQSDPSHSDTGKLARAVWAFALPAAAQSLVMAFFPFVPLGVGAIITIYLTGMSAGMVPSTAGCRPVVASYTCITMGAIAAAWALSPDSDRDWADRLLFVAMIAAYTKVLLDYARGAYRVFSESYEIRLERVELNEQLSEALRNAEAANRAKTRFLAAASHDLRQPIHALSLFSGSMLLRPLDPRSTAIAHQIDKSVKVLGSQLDALLDISRLDAGVVGRSIETIDLAAVLSQLSGEFGPQAERKELKFQTRCPESLLVRTDSLLLRRVLGNLLSNAIKFTVTGGIELAAERVGSSCRVWVRDTGPGIPDAEHERVFEEFYQLGNPERDRVQGLGLGLAIVRRLGELLQVQIQMDSQVGRGTTFTVELPAAAREDALMPAPVPHALSPVRHLNVLVVDDEEDVRVGMRTLLEEMGFSVRVTSSTQGAIECSRDFVPSVVLADFRLLGEDSGINAVRALRQVWPRLPALLVSGDTAPDRLREAHSEGIDLLHKPVGATLLRDSILKATAA